MTNSQSYWDGRMGRPDSGDNPTAYQIGKKDAAALGDGSYGCLPFFIFLILLAYLDFFIPSLLVSIGVALILYLAASVFVNRKYDGNITFPFVKMFGIGLLATLTLQGLVFFAVNAVISTQYSLSSVILNMPKDETRMIHFDLSDHWAFLLLPVLAAAGILITKYRHIPYFKGFVGYLKLTVVSFFLAILSLIGFYLWLKYTGFQMFKEPVEFTI